MTDTRTETEAPAAKKGKRTSRTSVKAEIGLAQGASGKGVSSLQDYLVKFGYLRPAGSKAALNGGGIEELDARPELQPNAFDQNTEEALRQFQMMAAIPVTGVFDEATAAKMKQPRCGVPDRMSFVATGGRWPTNDLTYAFQNFCADVSQAQCRQAIHQAFSTWAGWSPLTFREAPLASAHIILRFVTGDHGDGAPFDGSGNVLAHAFFPPVPPANPVAIQGDTHFDEAETWTLAVPPGASQIDLTTVAVHEFGHALGLNHSPVAGAVMQAFYGGPRRYLHNDDISGISTIYGGFRIAEASWVHGTSVQVEVPGALESIRRMGFFTRVVGMANTTNWFHFAIPTPVIVNDVRKGFGRCMLRFNTGGPAAMVRDVHLYDGEVRVAAHDNVNLSGGNAFRAFGVAHAPRLLWGIGISVGVTFGQGTAAQRTIDFISAGCDVKP